MSKLIEYLEGDEFTRLLMKQFSSDYFEDDEDELGFWYDLETYGAESVYGSMWDCELKFSINLLNNSREICLERLFDMAENTPLVSNGEYFEEVKSADVLAEWLKDNCRFRNFRFARWEMPEIIEFSDRLLKGESFDGEVLTDCYFVKGIANILTTIFAHDVVWATEEVLRAD